MAENNHTHESRQREEAVDCTKAKSTCLEGVSRETHEVEKNSKVGDKQKENISEADKGDTTKDTAVSASTQAPQLPAEANQQKEVRELEKVKYISSIPML
jgi:hypothetical protein